MPTASAPPRPEPIYPPPLALFGGRVPKSISGQMRHGLQLVPQHAVGCAGYLPFLELFARGTRPGWKAWGNQAETYEPTWPTYSNHSGKEKALLKKEQLRLVEQERAAFK